VGSTCIDWFTDPDKANKYECWFGTHLLASLDECTLYAPSFDPTKQAIGQGLADPTTGLSTGTQTAPGTDAPGQNVSPDTGDQRQGCFPTGWAVFNPLEWVFRPVQCAMNWAFVPRQSELQKDGARVDTAWKTTAPYRVVAAVNVWAGQLPTVSGCAGPHLAFAWTLPLPPILGGPRTVSYDGYPMSACSDPAKTLADIGRVLGALGLYYYATLAVVRNISGIVNQRGIGEGTT
jgi:hypothetical protein